MQKIIDEKIFTKLVGKKLRQIREKSGLSQTQFVILGLGYNRLETYAAQQKISKMETGKQPPTILELHLILSAFHIDFDNFIKDIIKKV